MFFVLCRRWFLVALMGASAVAWAQSGDRAALVVGNSAYRMAPLFNPQNDAKAMGGLLRDAGFLVDQQIDTSLEQLQKAVAAFGQKIQDPKIKFAVFYYAGHGVQLDWRNYLVPVTAAIRSADDVRSQTVDVSSLLKYMGEAKNKNYIIILDACRDDPFAGSFRPPAKGLSQFDAPVGSVLAYSTSPGKVALDGEGSNGLYTAYLLKEFAIKGVKIEDAFKRTRLNVRLASNGAQVPWETTSLEDDLYLFPEARKHLTDAEQDKLLEQELAAWAKVKNTNDFLALAEFIRIYPSGSVSELASSRMNRLLSAQQAREIRAVTAKSVSLQEAETERQAREEALKLAAQKAEAARLEAARAEADRLEALRIEVARQEAQRVEAAKAEAARQEAVRLEAARAESARVAALQAEQARLAALRAQEAQAAAIGLAAETQARERRESDARIALLQAEQARQEQARAEAARVVAAQAEAARQETARQAIAKAQAAHQDNLRAALMAENEAKRVQAERLALEQAQAQKVAAQQAQAARIEAQRLQAEREQAARLETARAAQAAEQAAKAQAEAARAALLLAQQKETQAAAASAAAAPVIPPAPGQSTSTGLPGAGNAAVLVASLSEAIAATPFFSGATEHLRRYSVGDEFNFRVTDGFTKSAKPLVMRVTAVDMNTDQVQFNDGEYVSDLMGNILTNLRGSSSTPRQFYPADMLVGKRWRTQFKQVRASVGVTYTFRYDLKVVGKERITVPAGTFDTFKIEARGYNLELGARLERNIWVAPGVNADIAHETLVRLRNGQIEQNDRQELITYKQKAQVPSSSLASR